MSEKNIYVKKADEILIMWFHQKVL